MIDLRPNRHKPSYTDKNMMPVINMTFLLLLFFIVSGNFQQKLDTTVSLPTSKSQKLIETETPELQLRQDGELSFKGKVVSVETWLQSYQQRGVLPPTTIRLLADTRTPASIFMPVIDAFREHNIESVALATKPRSSVPN